MTALNQTKIYKGIIIRNIQIFPQSFSEEQMQEAQHYSAKATLVAAQTGA